MTVAEIALTESKTLRAQYTDRIEVLDRVKTLAMASGTGYTFTTHVAAYFEVTEESIDQLVKRNRAELEENDYKVMTRAELESVTSDTLELPANFRRAATFRRRTVVNLAMLMDGNDIARQVRTYLLNLEEAASLDQKATALNDPLAELERQTQLTTQAIVIAKQEREGREIAETRIAELEPRAAKYDAVLDADGLIGMTAVADQLRTDVVTLTNWLVEQGLFRKEVSQSQSGPKNRNLPRRAWQRSGHFEVRTEHNGPVKFPVAYATSTGLDHILTLWRTR